LKNTFSIGLTAVVAAAFMLAASMVLAQIPCCVQVTAGPAQPADHTWRFDPRAPNRPNLMMHAKICLPTTCQQALSISGIALKAGGSGNDAADIAGIRVLVDGNCDGTPDRLLQGHPGGYGADDGVLTLCNPGEPVRVMPGECVCIIVEYVLRESARCGSTFQFTLVQVLAGPDCVPVSACEPSVQLKSAVKTVTCDDCCLVVSPGGHFPPDHSFQCPPAGTAHADASNFMGEYRVCNPCDVTRCVSGIRLRARGTGDDLKGVDKVIVSLDFDCDGKPDRSAVASGYFDADDGVMEYCRADGKPLFCVRAGGCVCIQVHYVMRCPAPPGTYGFTIEALYSGPECQPVCTEWLPARSAIKTVGDNPCCAVAYSGPAHPPDHTYRCPLTGGQDLNFMQQVQVCNPCDWRDLPIHGVRLKAYGSGDDVAGISRVELWLDSDCDGTPDAGPVAAGVYPEDDGELVLCSPGQPIAVLLPGACVCLNIYYRMKCPDPPPGKYVLELTHLLGPDCQPLCQDGLPLRSAAKIVEPQLCCLQVDLGPTNPPDHRWSPGMPRRNVMQQMKICNPCPSPVLLKCIRLQAGGSGDDAKDIQAVRVWIDYNCNGQRDAGDTPFGAAVYPVDNGIAVICPQAQGVLQPEQCLCLVVEYLLKPGSKPGVTYFFRLVALEAVHPATGLPICVDGLPLPSSIKHRCHLIGEAKLAVPGTYLCLHRKVVTAIFPDRFYVQEPFQTSVGKDEDSPGGPAYGPGIAVLSSLEMPAGTEEGPEVGELVDIEGITAVHGCEVIIIPEVRHRVGSLLPAVQKALMTQVGSGGGPFGFQSGVSDCSDSELPVLQVSRKTNNVGSLVAMCGRVLAADESNAMFWFTDGSQLCDGSVRPVQVGVGVDASHAGPLPAVGSFVMVTGILSAVEDESGMCVRRLIPRGRSDIQVLVGP